MGSHEERIAKRLAEIHEELAGLDREEAERAAAAADPASRVVEGREDGWWRSAVFLVGLIVFTAALIGGAVTLNRLAGKDFDDAQRIGQATITSCAKHGPITKKGFGYWERCNAKIAWDDGEVDLLTVDDVFRPADIGTEVRVADISKHAQSNELVQADAPHRPWLRWIGIAMGVVATLPIFVVALMLGVGLRYPRRRSG